MVAGLGDEGDGALGVEAELGEDGADLAGVCAGRRGSRDPCQKRRSLRVGLVGGVFEERVGGHHLFLGFVDLAGQVAVEDGAVGGLEGGDGGFALVPCGFGSEEDAVPVVVGEGFAVVVPDGVELAGGAELLAVAGELLDVGEGVVPVGIDAGPVVDAGGDPGLACRRR